jgi:hypothetical protein
MLQLKCRDCCNSEFGDRTVHSALRFKHVVFAWGTRIGTTMMAHDAQWTAVTEWADQF